MATKKKKVEKPKVRNVQLDIGTLFPAFLVTPEIDYDALPNNCYLVAKNGMYLYINNNGYKVVQEIDKLAGGGIADAEEGLINSFKPFTEEVMEVILDFFRWVHREYESEAFMYLYYNSESGDWKAEPVKQQVSGGSAHYEGEPNPPDGYRCVGTTHSHADMSAFQSGTDDKDQNEFDGIHMTVGKMGNIVHDYDIYIYVRGSKYKVKPKHMLPESVLTYEADTRPEWKELVSKKVYPKQTGFTVLKGGLVPCELSEKSINDFLDNVTKWPNIDRRLVGTNCAVKLEKGMIKIECAGMTSSISYSSFSKFGKNNQISFINSKVATANRELAAPAVVGASYVAGDSGVEPIGFDDGYSIANLTDEELAEMAEEIKKNNRF